MLLSHYSAGAFLPTPGRGSRTAARSQRKPGPGRGSSPRPSGACATEGLRPRPCASCVVAQRRFPGRASVARRPHHSPARLCCSSFPSRPRRVASGGARICSVYTRVSAEASQPGRQLPQRSPSERCPPEAPTAAPPPGGPEIGDGRHCSRARAEGCGAARSRTAAPAAEVTAPRGNGLGAHGWAAGAGRRG